MDVDKIIAGVQQTLQNWCEKNVPWSYSVIEIDLGPQNEMTKYRRRRMWKFMLIQPHGQQLSVTLMVTNEIIEDRMIDFQDMVSNRVSMLVKGAEEYIGTQNAKYRNY